MSIEKKIEDTIESSIRSFFSGKEVKVEHVLDLIFPRERRIRSLIGGLETSLGTRLWEPLARTFAAENGFTDLNAKVFNQKAPVLPSVIVGAIAEYNTKKRLDNSVLISDLRKVIIDLIAERPEIIENLEFSTINKGEGVDLWLKKDGVVYLIDIKTNQINAGSGPKFCSNMLNWVAYHTLTNQVDEVRCILAFPFNPHKTDFWKKEGGKASPLLPKVEALVGDEFWDFLYGKENTTSIIFSQFEKLGKSDFGSQFSDIFEVPKSKIDSKKI